MRWVRGSTLALMLLASPVAGAQGEVEIVHDPIQCWPVDQFLLIQSSFAPPGDVQTAKFYFRSTAQPDYYYVELTRGSGGGRAIAPKAEPGTPGVTYYLELVTRSYVAFRTEEREVPVATGVECKRRDPETAFYTGQNPDIAVGATRMGASPLPPGFQADGIARFLNVTGIAGEAGSGGVSGKTIGILAGIGGAGAAALALSGGGSSQTTTTAIGGVTTTVGSTSSTSTAVGGVTSTTTTAGGGTSTISTTTVGGGPTTTIIGSSTTTSGGSTTTIIGSSTTSIGTSSTTTIGTSTSTIGSSTTTAGSSSSTTTSVGSTSSTTSSVASSSSTTTSVGTAADLGVVKREGKDPVAVGEIFDYFIDVTNNGPANAAVVGLNDTFPGNLSFLGSQNASCSLSRPLLRCSVGSMNAGTSRTVRLIVRAESAGTANNSVTVVSTQPDPNSSNNTSSVSTRVNLTLRTSPDESLDLSYASTLHPRPMEASVRGFVILNHAHFLEAISGGPRVLNARARAGENDFEAYLDSSAETRGIWRFDFQGTPGFVSGSIRVESGTILSLEGQAVVFALSTGQARIRFRIELRDPDPPRFP